MRTEQNSPVVRHESHKADFVVCGGGLAGVCAAVSAARHGAKVVLIQDRPVLGGNSSSEIRVGIKGALGKNDKETGILEEMEMENLYRNPSRRYTMWDGGVLTNEHAWYSRAAQIVLLIDRDDGIINLCEMKFSDGPHAISKQESEDVRRRKLVLKEETSTRKAVYVTYVTTEGLVRNSYANDVQSEVTLDDLFEA